MFLRVTALVLVSILAFSVASGVPLHSSEHSCDIKTKVQGCEHAGMQFDASIGPAVGLCCLLDCQEPAPTGTAFNLRIRAFQVAFVHPAVLAAPETDIEPLPQEKWLQGASFTSPHRYLKNLALLI